MDIFKTNFYIKTIRTLNINFLMVIYGILHNEIKCNMKVKEDMKYFIRALTKRPGNDAFTFTVASF
jgi:hypothetical protein